jgi:hypothetical protein
MSDEIIIDFSKIIRIINYRKHYIILPIILLTVISIIITMFLPKKYESEVKILINKANSTNMTDVNPFLTYEGGGSSYNGIAGIINGNSNLSDEIEILKSPIVLDKIIKDNSLNISAEDFIKNDYTVDNIKGSSVIRVKYKSDNPKQTYNVLNSIVTSYKSFYTEVNSKKADNDRKIILNSYQNARKELQKKIIELKSLKSASLDNTTGISSSNIAILGFYDKRIKNNITQVSANSVNSQKLEQEIQIITDKIKTLNARLEWSSMIDQVSKDATKVIILKQPSILKSNDYTEPSLFVNIMFSLCMAIVFGLVLLVKKEISDNKLTFSDIDNDSTLVKSEIMFDLTSFKVMMAAKKINNIKIISLGNEESCVLIANSLKNTTNLNFDLIRYENSVFDNLSDLEGNNIVILSQIGFSDRKTYQEIKQLINNLNINLLSEYIFTYS